MGERLTYDQLCALLPEAVVERLPFGELVIYTGLTDAGVGDGEPLLPWHDEYEKCEHDPTCPLAEQAR